MPKHIHLLVITIGVDDYKPRGRSPETIVSAFSSLEGAEAALVAFLKKKLLDLDCTFSEFQYGVSRFKNLMKKQNEGDRFEFDPEMEILVEKAEDIQYTFFEGEYIPLKWDYYLQEQEVQEFKRARRTENE